MQIKTKSEFYRLWKAGVLGNRTQIWSSLEEALAGESAKIGFREVGKAGGGAWERVERCDLIVAYRRWKDRGRLFIMDDSVPNEHAVLQGEVCRTFRGLESYLVVGHAVPPMRQTMAAGLHRSYGYLATKTILDQYMDPSSRGDLDDLLELYPEATVEFTTFDIDVGNIPGRNTIFWETRNY